MRYKRRDGDDVWHCDGCYKMLVNPELQEVNCGGAPVHPMPKGWESQTVDFECEPMRPGYGGPEPPDKNSVFRFVFCEVDCCDQSPMQHVERFVGAMHGKQDLDGLVLEGATS